MVEMVQGRPRPRKTLTALEARMGLKMSPASYTLSFSIIERLMLISGIAANPANITNPRIVGLIPKKQSKFLSTSMIKYTKKHVRTAQNISDAHPPTYLFGGTSPKSTFQGMVMQCVNAFQELTSSIASVESILGPKQQAMRN